MHGGQGVCVRTRGDGDDVLHRPSNLDPHHIRRVERPKISRGQQLHQVICELPVMRRDGHGGHEALGDLRREGRARQEGEGAVGAEAVLQHLNKERRYR